eukprot:82942_1
MLTQFKNCKLVRDRKLLSGVDLWVKDGKVIDPQKRFWSIERASVNTSCSFVEPVVVDCKGCIIAPGYIDLQINGAFGVDFSSETLSKSDVELVGRRLLSHGVTAFLPTVVTSAPTVHRALL